MEHDERTAMINKYEDTKQEHYFNNIPDPSPGTLEDVFTRMLKPSKETIRELLDSAPSLLGQVCWITGDPASGKAVLMKHIVTELREKIPLPSSGSRRIVLSYFFDEDGTLSQGSCKIMIQNLLVQLYEQLPILVERLFVGVSSTEEFFSEDFGNNDWGLNLWQEVFMKAVREAYDKSIADVFIFLDGISGFEVEQGHTDTFIDVIIGRIGSIPGVKLFIASRPEGLFMDWMCREWRSGDGSRVPRVIPTLDLQKLDTIDNCKWIEQMSGDQREHLYSSLLSHVKAQAKARFTVTDGGPVKLLSSLLNNIIAHENHASQIHHEHRPLSLLQLALHVTEDERVLEQRGLLFAENCVARRARWDNLIYEDRYFIPQLIQHCEKLADTIDSQCYPLIVTRKMDRPTPTHPVFIEKFSPLVRATEMQVTLLHPSLRQFLQGSAKGKELLEIDNEFYRDQLRLRMQARGKPVLQITPEMVWDDRFTSLSVASFCESVILAPEEKVSSTGEGTGL